MRPTTGRPQTRTPPNASVCRSTTAPELAGFFCGPSTNRYVCSRSTVASLALLSLFAGVAAVDGPLFSRVLLLFQRHSVVVNKAGTGARVLPPAPVLASNYRTNHTAAKDDPALQQSWGYSSLYHAPELPAS